MLTHVSSPPLAHRRSAFGSGHLPVSRVPAHSRIPPGPLHNGAPRGARRERSDRRDPLRILSSIPRAGRRRTPALSRSPTGFAQAGCRFSAAPPPVHLINREEIDRGRKGEAREDLGNLPAALSIPALLTLASTSLRSVLRFASALRVTRAPAPISRLPAPDGDERKNERATLDKA